MEEKTDFPFFWKKILKACQIKFFYFQITYSGSIFDSASSDGKYFVLGWKMNFQWQIFVLDYSSKIWIN